MRDQLTDGRELRAEQRHAWRGQGDNEMAIYRFADAGDNTFNGDYVESGTQDGAPLFQLGSDRFLFWSDGNQAWMLQADQPDDTAPYYAGGSNINDPTDGEWVAVVGLDPAPTVTLLSEAPPWLIVWGDDDVSIDATGKILTVVFPLPVIGTAGLALANLKYGKATLSNYSIDGNTLTAKISRFIYKDETPTLAYGLEGEPADITSDDGALAPFSGVEITNNSTADPRRRTAWFLVF